MARIIGFALRFSPAHDALVFQRLALTGDDGALSLSMIVVVVEKDPVVRLAHLMGMGGVGEHRLVMPVSTLSMQNGKPGFMRWVEAVRGDPAKVACLRTFTVFSIHIEYLFDGRFGTRRPESGWALLSSHASQPAGQGFNDPSQLLGADAFNVREAPIVSGHFQLFQGVDAEVVMQTSGQAFADTRHGRQNRDRIHFPSEAVEHRQPSGHDEIVDRTGEADPDPRQLFEPIHPLSMNNLCDRPIQSFQRVCRVAISQDTKAVRALVLQEFGHFSQTLGDIEIQHDRRHSYRNASMGLSRDARFAG